MPSKEAVFHSSHTIWCMEELHRLYSQSLLKKFSMYKRSLNLDICFSPFWEERSFVKLGCSFIAELALVWSCWNWWLCPRLFSARWKNSFLNAALFLFTSGLHRSYKLLLCCFCSWRKEPSWMKWAKILNPRNRLTLKRKIVSLWRVPAYSNIIYAIKLIFLFFKLL